MSRPKTPFSEFKICTKCGIEKPLAEYHIQEQGKFGRASWCKMCVADLHSKYRRETPDRLKAQKKKSREKHKERLNKKRYEDNLKSYGITLKEYEIILEQQQGVCAICGKPELTSGRTRLSVDHNHKTGEIRGLLCNHCNAGLGHFFDSEELIENALRYISNED